MSLYISFKCLYYSFCYGFMMMFFYCLLKRIVFRFVLLNILVQFMTGVLLGVVYFYGLVLLNYGIVRLYFFVMLFLGYLFFMRYYKNYVMTYIEIIVQYVRKILLCRYFFFNCINAIIRLKRRLMKRCQRKKE